MLSQKPYHKSSSIRLVSSFESGNARVVVFLGRTFHSWVCPHSAPDAVHFYCPKRYDADAGRQI